MNVNLSWRLQQLLSHDTTNLPPQKKFYEAFYKHFQKLKYFRKNINGTFYINNDTKYN